MAEAHDNIPQSADLKNLSSDALAKVAACIRTRLIEVTSVNGGHLASSLGAVDLILALHSVYDFPTDKLVFDVGHQSYAHKLITGRAEKFDTLRTYGGLSGFTRREESPFDAHDSGHASDSLSIALGLALARDLNKTSERIVALIGDAALSGGMAFEALNQIGQAGSNLVIVLNDNEMSISRNVGALSLYLSRVRMSKPYTTVRDKVEGGLESTGRIGRFLVNAGEAAKDSFKKLMVPGTLFEDMGIMYIGPIDGHSIEKVSAALRLAQKANGPVLIHVVTQKGHGFAPAEQRPDVFHGVGCYDPLTGEPIRKAGTPTFTSVFSQALIKEAEVNPSVVAITAAMADGTGLTEFSERFPERFFDVGIAEEHGVALSAGLALGGKLPVVAIYSTFLQRAYDQLLINVALQNQHVVFCVDRAGLVGEDGTTHHGLFDLAYLRTIPNMRILVPADRVQLEDALHTALLLDDAPIALRYPRGEAPLPRTVPEVKDSQILPLGKAIKLREGSTVSLLAVGRMVDRALDAAEILALAGIDAAVYNMLWVKPVDTETVLKAAAAPLVVTLEEGTTAGGLGSAVLEVLAEASLTTGKQGDTVIASSTQVLNLGIPDDFVTHGATELLFEELGLTAPQIAERIERVLKRENQAL